MAAILIVVVKLFATALMPTTCNNNFFSVKNTFCSNFAFLAATFVAVKNGILVVYNVLVVLSQFYGYYAPFNIHSLM
jgi:hypothetical protein